MEWSKCKTITREQKKLINCIWWSVQQFTRRATGTFNRGNHSMRANGEGSLKPRRIRHGITRAKGVSHWLSKHRNNNQKSHFSNKIKQISIELLINFTITETTWFLQTKECNRWSKRRNQLKHNQQVSNWNHSSFEKKK